MVSHVLFLKINQARKTGEISCCFYIILKSEYKYSSLFWFSTGAVQKGNCGMLPWSLATRYMYRESPMTTVGCTADLLEHTPQDDLSHKALLNLHLSSPEMLKVFIHIPVSPSTSAFLQAGIPPPPPPPPPHCFMEILVWCSWKLWRTCYPFFLPCKVFHRCEEGASPNSPSEDPDK